MEKSIEFINNNRNLAIDSGLSKLLLGNYIFTSNFLYNKDLATLTFSLYFTSLFALLIKNFLKKSPNKLRIKSMTLETSKIELFVTEVNDVNHYRCCKAPRYASKLNFQMGHFFWTPFSQR